ncbi:MAG: phosphotransferase, partial [Pirellulaceae bacterium]
MVMGLARGDTLEQRLKRDKQLPPPVIEQILDRLLDGLEEVHKAGFLHRDIKPANIVLDANGNPTLIDFGASRASVAGRTAGLTAVFTPRYAAAEQLTSDRQGP